VEQETAQEEQVEQPEPILKVEKLTKSYAIPNSKLTVLRDVDLRVRHGEFLAISGQSGSGKTTLLALLGSLDIPDSGEIWLDDIAVHRLQGPAAADFRRQKIGFVHLFSGNGQMKKFWKCWLCQLYFSVETGIIHNNINTNAENIGKRSRSEWLMSKRVVAVDDDKEVREIVTFVLARNGFDVDAASNDQQLEYLLALQLADLIILDAMMPGMDGYSVFGRLYGNPETRYIPVIIMTAHAEDIYKRISVDLGAAQHITKPFHRLELVEKVKVLLQVSS
jgi:CheY-like chemotaxis protein